MIAARRVRLLHLACILAILLPLTVTPVLPLIDYYNHVARYYVLSHIGQEAAFAANYAAAWALLPNLGLDLVATPLLGVIPPLIAAKFIIGAILLVQFGGVIALNRSLGGRVGAMPAVLLPMLVYSYILGWGFANFLLGLGLAFWNLALWFRLRERHLPWAIALCSLGAILLFFCHGFAFAIYGVMLAGLELGRWLRSTARDIGGLAATAGCLLVQAVIPFILFLNMPTADATGKGGSPVHAMLHHAANGSLSARLDVEFWYRLRTIFRVAESPYPALDVITILLAAALIVLALHKKWLRLHPWAAPALLLLLLLTVAMPPSLFGVGYVSDRLPLAFVLLMASALLVADPLPSGGRRVVMALGAIALVKIVAIGVGWSAYARHYADFRAVMDKIPGNALVAEVLPSGQDRRDGLLPRCQMYGPLALLMNDDIVSLFANPSQQPIRLIGPIRQANVPEDSDRPDIRVHDDPAYYDRQLAAIVKAARYDYVIVCKRYRLIHPLPPGMRLVAEKGDISILALR